VTVLIFSGNANVPDRRSVKCLDPGIQGISLGDSVSEGGGQPKTSPAPPGVPKRAALVTQMQWRHHVPKVFLTHS
jgi:hypothetical protein